MPIFLEYHRLRKIWLIIQPVAEKTWKIRLKAVRDKHILFGYIAGRCIKIVVRRVLLSKTYCTSDRILTSFLVTSKLRVCVIFRLIKLDFTWWTIQLVVESPNIELVITNLILVSILWDLLQINVEYTTQLRTLLMCVSSQTLLLYRATLFNENQ